jgi:hypothetical protein
MKIIGFTALIVVLFLLVCSEAFSQVRDIVYLKNGSIVKGTIVELIPDKTVKIETSDGSLFVFNLSEVEKIEKEQATEPGNHEKGSQISARRSGPAREFQKKNSVTISAGVSLPVGDFSSSSTEGAGAAQTGFAFGVDGSVGVAPELAWMTSLNFSFNSMDVGSASSALTDISINAGSWSSVWLLTGLKAGGPVGPNVEFSGFGQVGLVIASIPEIHVYSSTATFTENSATATAFGYSVGTGLTFGHVGLTLRYLHSEPEFNITGVGTDGTSTTTVSGTYKQSISIMQILGTFSF